MRGRLQRENCCTQLSNFSFEFVGHVDVERARPESLLQINLEGLHLRLVLGLLLVVVRRACAQLCLSQFTLRCLCVQLCCETANLEA